MLVNGDRVPYQCPVVGNYEETQWSGQCPMASQWSKPENMCIYEYGYNEPYSKLPNQRFSGNYVCNYAHQYYGNQVQTVYVPQTLNLPCQGQQWDYNTMCFDVEGQPCQYTNVVDLEDFMNNEKRKEKSRVAARCRRTKEMQIFAELTAALPAKKEEVEQLDKASVMRLAISYLRVRDVVSMLPEGNVESPKLQSPKGLEDIQSELSYMQALDGFVLVLSQQGDIVYCSENIAEHLGVSQEAKDKRTLIFICIAKINFTFQFTVPEGNVESPKLQSPKGLEDIQSELSYMQALDGFVLVLSQQGDIVYCSENIAEHLGVSQMEIMGQSVFEFSHPCDHEEVREALRNGAGRRDLLLRLKCTLTSKGRNVHLKSASYKVIHLTGHMLSPSNYNEKDSEQNTEVEDKKDSDGKQNKSGGSLVAVGRPIPHPSNIEIPLDSTTFLSKHSLDMKFSYTDEGLMNTLGFEPDELVGRSLYDYHHAADTANLAQQFKSLFSKGQCETGQYRFLAKTGGYAWVQTQATVITDKQQKPISVVCVNYVISGIECRDEVFAAHQVQHADIKPIVVPKPQKAAPAPICHPATEAGNGAIVAAVLPEEERPIPVTELIFAPRKKEMNKGFLMFSQDEGLTMLKDEPEDLTHLAPTAGDACIPLENTPFDMFEDFILSDNYCSLLGDDLATGSPVDSLTADSLLSSPDPQETESSCEQSSLLTELTLDAFDNGRSDNDIEDGNSPFIPTSDELPVLESAVMWGALPDNVSLARPQPSETQSVSNAPALQRLLAAAPTGPPPQDLITNIYSDQGLIPNRSVSSWDTGVKRVLKQEEEPIAKRVKRSPSPAEVPRTQSQSSSVLMNLLDMPQQMQQNQQNALKISSNYQQIMNGQGLPQLGSINRNNIPIPVINVIQSSNNMMRSNTPITCINNAMSPLTLNVNSSMYSLPPSPNTSNYTSPAMSPAQRDLLMSPYSTPQSLSPVGTYTQGYSPNSRNMSPVNMLHGYDPYLNNKMQPSPGFPLQQNDMLLDTNMSLTSTDFWTDPEVMQGTSDLLMAFDDVKLG
ncbi:Hypoxia-inducible factor 1-alpha [Papilio machaon]|uniref:Hypoxia-inducible factor 1-alpha n=1 Tax=Papilio machaon TaxID=76193 RepID=A0A194RKJ2_PAPMA|nr:Hypoxia-inducible factor 1-alpha [Papilio machaon]